MKTLPAAAADSSKATDKIAARRVPARSDVPVGDQWDLSPLFPDDPAWEHALAAIGGDFQEVERFRGRLAESPQTLRDALEFEKALTLRLEAIGQYAGLRTSEDGSNMEHLSKEARLQSLLTRIAEAFSFLIPEMQQISDEDFATFLTAPVLAEWTIPLKKIRRLKPHTLTPEGERLLALGDSALSGHRETFSQLTNVDMKFGEVADGDGNSVELTQSSFSSLLLDRSPSARKASFHQFYAEFSDHRHTLASSLASSVRTDVFHARARNFSSSLEAALFRDDVPVAVYENLIATVRENLPPLFDYFNLRRDVLGLAEIHHYDTYVPLVSEFRARHSWDEAVEKVVASLEPLGGEYCRTLRHGLTEGRWCDRYENKGKRSGAFSSGTYRCPPYILMNYKEDVFSDVYTLAHEAGHSMHTWHSREAQLFQNYNYPIFLAEVASTFNEMLLTEHLLATETNPAMRAYLINRQIDDFRGTLYRQTMFAEFEKSIHEIEESGGALTLETFRETYRSLLDTYFGDSVVIDDDLEIECLRIPHFYNAFYVYKYATGLSAAVALARQVIETGDASSYIDFLRSGGSKFPLETLRAAGVDMASSNPIRAALELFGRRVAELRELL